jgi:hypothetical protein
MAVIQEIYNGDVYYQSLLDKGKLMLDCNDMDLALLNEKDEFLRRISTTYYNLEDGIDNIPRCLCGNLRGVYANGIMCNNCGTKATRPLDEAYPTLWARVDDPDFKFLNPMYYMLLAPVISTCTVFKARKYMFDPILWLTDISYRPISTAMVLSMGDDVDDVTTKVDYKKNILRGIEALKTLIKELTGCDDREIVKYRNYPFIMSNLRRILEIARDTNLFQTSNDAEQKERKVKEIEILIKLYDKYKDELFSLRLPIIIDNKELVQEKTFGIKPRCFVDMTSGDLRNIIYKWNRICKQLSLVDDPKKRRIITNKLVTNYLHSYTEYMNGYTADNIAGKPGLIRRHIYGCKSHYTFRCVIASIAGPHEPDEVIVPWVIGLIVYRPHIMNILLNRYRYSYRKASELVANALLRYEPVISEIFDILLRESPTGRLPTIMQRNPALKRGSSLKVWIKDFKRDNVTDFTLNVSPKIIKLPNGDYDGAN